MILRKHFVAATAGLALAGAFGFAQAQDADSKLLTANTATTTQSTSAFKADKHLPWEAIGGIGGAWILFSLLALRGREKSWKQATGLHAAAGVAFVGALANPGTISHTFLTVPNEVVIVVDRSESQSLGDRKKQTDLTLTNLQDALKAYPDLIVHTLRVGDSPDGQTKLFAPLSEILNPIPEQRRAGVFMITDGRVHDAPEPDVGLGDSAVPLHALITGTDREYDRRVSIESTTRLSAVGSEQSVSVRLIDDGVLKSSAPTPVQVLHGDEVLAESMLVPGETKTINFALPRMGAYNILVSTPADADEVTSINNQQLQTMDVVRKQGNVLLFSSSITRNAAALRSGLKLDPDTNLTHLNILRPPGKQDATPLKDLATVALPLHEIFGEKMPEFDTVFIDQYRNDGLVHPYHFEALARRVENGGSLFVITGREYTDQSGLAQTPLARVLPLWADDVSVPRMAFRAQPSTLGARHPILRDLYDEKSPWGSWYQQSPVYQAPQAADRKVTTLLNGASNMPVMAISEVGKGRVAMIASDQLFLWANGHQGGGPYAQIMNRVFQWLSKNPDYDAEYLRLKQIDENLSIDVQTMDPVPPVLNIQMPNQDIIQKTPDAVSPGLWRVTVPAAQMGLYSVKPVTGNIAPAAIHLGPVAVAERGEVTSTLDVLDPVVVAQGGLIARVDDGNGTVRIPPFYTLGDGNVAGAMGLKLSQDTIKSGQDHNPFLPPWAWMMLSIGFLGLGWARESELKRSEMVASLNPLNWRKRAGSSYDL